jgi:hypothetical protein
LIHQELVKWICRLFLGHLAIGRDDCGSEVWKTHQLLAQLKITYLLLLQRKQWLMHLQMVCAYCVGQSLVDGRCVGRGREGQTLLFLRLEALGGEKIHLEKGSPVAAVGCPAPKQTCKFHICKCKFVQFADQVICKFLCTNLQLANLVLDPQINIFLPPPPPWWE